MATAEGKKMIRIEDVIALANEGKKVQVVGQLIIRPIIEKALAEIGETEDVEAYLLMGNFKFMADGQSYEMTKTYLRGFKSESLEARAANLKIANFRLKSDYERLKAAGVDIEPIYFEEFHL
jgi:hypothetical protein